jgi:hypothetical protein
MLNELVSFKFKIKLLFLKINFYFFLVLVANRHELVTENLLTKLFVIWHHEKLFEFTNERKDDVDSDCDEKIAIQQQQRNRLKVNNFIFSNIISARFMVMMEGREKKCFETYAKFIVELIREKFITGECINEQSVGLYQYEWNKVKKAYFLYSFH